MATVISVTSPEQFHQIIKQDKLSVFHFWAGWSGSCRAMSPVFQKFSGSYPSIGFYTIDIVACKDLSEELDIRTLPAFFFFRNGEKLDMFVGPQAQQLGTLIQRFADVV